MLPSDPPLPTLLSQAWVAFTIEADNLSEQAMPHSTTRSAGQGGGPWLVSQVMWWTCMRFVDERGITAADLERVARTKTNLNGMIRWGYITADGSKHRTGKMPATAVLRATAKGLAAREIWRPLTGEVEARWRRRIGQEAFAALEGALAPVVAMLGPNLPGCMPILGYGLACPAPVAATEHRTATRLSLPELLARTLLAFTLEYERRSALSLAIAANVLRLVDGQGCRLRDLPGLSGVSEEAIAVATGFLERRHLARVTSEGRVRRLTLTPAGVQAREAYPRIVAQVEAAWRARCGDPAIRHLVDALAAVVTGERGEANLQAAIAAPPSGWRAASKTRAVLPWQPMVLHRGGFPDGA